jgi:hypothetical protein
VVRVAVPGTAEGVVRIRLFGADGPVELPGGVVAVPGRSVQDVPVTGVPDGVYTAVVDSDVPVLAAGLVGRSLPGSEKAGTSAGVAGDSPPAEFAWAPAARPLDGPAVVALPRTGGARAATARLALTTGGGAAATATVRLVDSAGALGPASEVDVPAEGTTTVELGAGSTGVQVSAVAEAGLSAAVVLEVADSRGAMVAVLPLRSVPLAGRTGPVAVQDRMLGVG